MFNILSLLFVIFINFFGCVTPDNDTLANVNSTTIYCLNQTAIKILNISVELTKSECHYSSCFLTEHDAEIIESNCNGQSSCEVGTSMLSEKSRYCMEEYGHVDVSYFCKDVVEYSCDFQQGPSECGWITFSDNSFIWKRIKGSSSSLQTGPDLDHTYANSSGYYVFVDGHDCKNSNDFSTLSSGKIIPNGNQCLSFWYYMYGEDVRSLSVHIERNGTFTELLVMDGNRGKKWYNEKISLSESYPYSITFKANCFGKWFNEGDIAIDDVVITNRPCQNSELDCNFEEDLCMWTTNPDIKYVWTREYGSTHSDGTGPSYDHTTRSAVGYYIYLEASNIPENTTAYLKSTPVQQYSQSCFSFWYHMYGSGIGTLNVYLAAESSSLLWSASGNKGNKWLYADVDILANGNFQILFEGIRGNNFPGDIAIDDIVWLPGLCNGYFTQRCSDLKQPIKLTGCPKHYLQIDTLTLKFQPEVDGCSDEYKEVQHYTSLSCNKTDDMDICFLDINALKPKSDCFRDKGLQIDYTCAVKPLPVDSSHSDALSAGEVAAIVICLIGLILAIVLVIILIFRRKHHPKPPSYESGFTGTENKSYNYAVYKSEDTPKEQRNEIYENVNDKSCSPDDKRHTYLEFCPNTHGPSNNLSGKLISDDATAESPNKFILSRDKEYNQQDVYMNPEHNTKKENVALSIENSDIYRFSEEGTYNVSNDANHKEKETCLYSHTVDNVYDTTNQRQKNADRDDSYDHFSS